MAQSALAPTNRADGGHTKMTIKRIPHVIDNETHRLADVLDTVLAEHGGKSLDRYDGVLIGDSVGLGKRRSAQEQRAVEEAPKLVDPVQQTVVTVLRSYLNHPELDRSETRKLIQALAAPLPGVHVKALKAAYQAFGRSNDVRQLISTLQALPLQGSGPTQHGRPPAHTLTRDDLHLVCFDYVWS